MAHLKFEFLYLHIKEYELLPLENPIYRSRKTFSDSFSPVTRVTIEGGKVTVIEHYSTVVTLSTLPVKTLIFISNIVNP